MPVKKEVALSVVVPMYNESEALDFFFNTTIPILESMKLTYEIITINDGSRDDTLSKLILWNKKNPNIKVIDLSRNFGKEIALTAGLDHTSGQTVVPIDADLQDPPELIPQLYSKWKEGYEVVIARRTKRKGESLLKRATAFWFYKVIRMFSKVDIPANTGDFRLIDRKVVLALREIHETHRFMKGLFSWVGFKQTEIQYERNPRKAGKTKWNYKKLTGLAFEGITSFSSAPLRLATYLGFFISFLAFVYAGFVIVKKLLYGDPVQGYASMTAIILFVGGIQLITTGIIGEYLGRVFEESKKRPLYFTRESHGIDQDESK